MNMRIHDRRTARRQGFTLFELMVSLAILGILMGIMVPPFQRQRAGQASNNAAQALAASMKRAVAEGLKYEAYMVIRVTDTGWTISRVRNTIGGNPSWAPNTWELVSQGDFGHAHCVFAEGASTLLPLGPRGWPIGAGHEPNPALVNTNQLQPVSGPNGNDANGEHYRWTLDAGQGKYTVKMYGTGRVIVVGPT